MTRCVYYRAYFHYARVFYSTCAFSRREIVCASGLAVLPKLRVWICAKVAGQALWCSFSAFSGLLLPQSPFGTLVASIYRWAQLR